MSRHVFQRVMTQISMSLARQHILISNSAIKKWYGYDFTHDSWNNRGMSDHFNRQYGIIFTDEGHHTNDIMVKRMQSN